MVDESAEISASSSLKVTYLFASIYLVMLSFFILLTSMAQVEKKKQEEVMGSVQGTFSTVPRAAKSITIPSETGPIGKKIVVSGFESAVGRFAENTSNVADARIIEFDKYVEIRMPIEKFYFRGKNSIRRQYQRFFIELAKEIARTREAGKSKLEVLINYDEKTTQDFSLIRARLEEFGRKLINLNVNEEDFLLGITPASKSEAKFMYIRFYENIAGSEDGK